MWNKRSILGLGQKDEIIIQGRLSFSALRNNSLAPRYFNFYNFPKSEVPSPMELFSDGDMPEANYFFGR